MRLATVLSAVLTAGSCAAQEIHALDPAQTPHPERMLTAYLKSIAREQLDARRSEVEAISTREGYEKRKAKLREAALGMIGGLSPRTPLNPRVTGVLERDGYRVEKVIYESRPKFYVTANLYVPKDGQAKHPGILQPVGHSTTAKNRAFYQKIAIALVKSGFVVLTYDPIGQGERRIYWDSDLGDSKVGGTTQEHGMVGWQSLLGGESAARYRLWDGMRSIDYLLTRPEVDGSKIGVTGCSGGGTMTTYIAALDERVTAAAPACYISSWEEQLEGTGPQDAEQQFPDQLVHGLNHADWIGLAAPKPYLIVSTDQDFFPLAGARRSFDEMKRVYALYDAVAKVDWFHEPGGHGVPDASRNAICAFMRKWMLGKEGPVDSGEIRTEFEEDLNATPTGQVATSLGGETASTLNTKRFGSRVPVRKALTNAAGAAALRQELRGKIAKLTRYRASAAPLNAQMGAVRSLAGTTVQPLTYTSDTGLTVPALLCGSGAKLALYLDPRGKSAGLRENGDVLTLVRKGYTVLALDMSGSGETAFKRHDTAPWGYPQLVWLGLMTGRPLLGIRINDIRRGLDAMEALGKLPPDGAAGFAYGRFGAVLLHAAVMDDRIRSVYLEQGLLSYRAAAGSAIYRDLEDSIIPGVLGEYDLPDLAASLAPRAVRIVNGVAPNGRLLLRKEVSAEFAYTAQVFGALGASDAFTVGLRRESEPVE